MAARSRNAAPFAALFLLLPFLGPAAEAQWAAQPGERVRNAFGESTRRGPSVCRGACGAGCPSSCREETVYECVDAERLRRVRVYACGTHEGCRTHDDCLDRCARDRAQGYDCETQCHGEAVETWGLERSMTWATGNGPYDGDPIVFEYTTDGPGLPEPAYRCPEGSSRACADGAGRCVADGDREVEPVFDSYPAGKGGGMSVAGFRAGRVCESGGRPSRVCETTQEIEVAGDGAWYGFEFDYRNADPTQPIVCEASGPEEDFLGGILAGALRAMPSGESGGEVGRGGSGARSGAGSDDMRQLGDALGALQEGLKSGRSLTDVLSEVRVTPHGASEPVGGGGAVGSGGGRGATTSGARRTDASGRALPPPGVPREVDIRTPSGHLLVPMYEPLEASSSGTLVREVRCLHRGVPVLETTFRLRFAPGGAAR